MTQKKNKHPEWILFFIILSFGMWGCAHGQNKAPFSSGPGNAAAQDSGDVVVDDPLFDSIPDDTTAVAGEDGQSRPDVEDPLFDSMPDEPSSSEQAVVDDDLLFEDDDDDLFDDEPVDLSVDSLVWDPLMPFNRVMFVVNDKLYFWVLKPVAQGYKAVTPQFFRTGVKNAFRNIAMPVRFVSCLLQLKIKGAGTELGRFLVNTTLGVGGVWDPADQWMGLKPYREDMGQAFGSYGIGNGFYIVLPFLGPTTARDGVGLVGDMFLHPLYYVEPSELSVGLGVLDVVNGTTFRLGDYEALKKASMDPYVMLRDFYINHRITAIAE